MNIRLYACFDWIFKLLMGVLLLIYLDFIGFGSEIIEIYFSFMLWWPYLCSLLLKLVLASLHLSFKNEMVLGLKGLFCFC